MIKLIFHLTEVFDHVGPVVRLFYVGDRYVEELDVFLHRDLLELLFIHQPVTSLESMY